MGEAEVAGRRVQEVDHRAVGLEEPRDLGDGRDQLVVDLALAAVGVVAPVAVGRGAPPGSGATASGSGIGGRGGSSRAPGLVGHDPRIRRARDARAWPFADGVYVIRPMPDASPVDGRAGRASATTSCPPPTVREGPPP